LATLSDFEFQTLGNLAELLSPIEQASRKFSEEICPLSTQIAISNMLISEIEQQVFKIIN
jgi:hypothetical protein